MTSKNIMTVCTKILQISMHITYVLMYLYVVNYHY